MSEDAGTVELTVEVVSGVLTQDVTLTYTTADDSATSPGDYTGANGVSIPALSAMTQSVTFRVALIDDDDVEPDEMFMVVLSGAPSGVTLDPATATVTIMSEDHCPPNCSPPVVIGYSTTEYPVDEGAGTVELTVEVISGVLTQDVTLTYTTADDSATSPGDYTGANGVSIPALSAMTQSVTFRVALIDDNDVEPDEMFMVVLSGAPSGVTLDPATATVTIMSEDHCPPNCSPPVVIGYSTTEYPVDEGAGTVELTVEVVSGVLTQDVTLTYTTADDSATSPGDYTGANGVSIPALSAMTQSVTFRVALIDDNDVEPDEMFMVVLSGAPSGVTLDPATRDSNDNERRPLSTELFAASSDWV